MAASILAEVLMLVLRLEVHRLVLVSTGEGDIDMGRASNNAEAWLALSIRCFRLFSRKCRYRTLMVVLSLGTSGQFD